MATAPKSAGTTAASDEPGSVPGPGADKHGPEDNFHGHAPYPSEADLQTRLAAATGNVTAPVAPPLPVDPGAPGEPTPPSR